jgi:hypothetical protein
MNDTEREILYAVIQNLLGAMNSIDGGGGHEDEHPEIVLLNDLVYCPLQSLLKGYTIEPPARDENGLLTLDEDGWVVG